VDLEICQLSPSKIRIEFLLKSDYARVVSVRVVIHNL
jgi:hypothetical protein